LTKSDAKYNQLKDLGTWGKISVKDDQIIALTSQMEALTATMNDPNTNKGSQEKKEKESSVSKWKYDKTLSSTDAYDCNDKTYKWYTKRGHWRVTTKHEMRKNNYKYYRPIIMTIWSFKRKQNPMGEITKYKARMCCHGG
jgi:hypothetical protein